MGLFRRWDYLVRTQWEEWLSVPKVETLECQRTTRRGTPRFPGWGHGSWFIPE